MFDKFLDCLGVRNLDEYRKNRKPNLRPYRSPDDERLTVSFKRGVYICFYLYLYNIQWLEGEFLNYLSDWKASVESRPDFTAAQKALMCMCSETIEGLHITGELQFLWFFCVLSLRVLIRVL